MTQKELLYLEDAIEHEKNMVKICEETINQLEDRKLIDFINLEIKKHIETQKQLMNILEVKANG